MRHNTEGRRKRLNVCVRLSITFVWPLPIEQEVSSAGKIDFDTSQMAHRSSASYGGQEYFLAV